MGTLILNGFFLNYLRDGYLFETWSLIAQNDLQFLISSLQSQVLGLQVCAIKAIQDFRILT